MRQLGFDIGYAKTAHCAVEEAQVELRQHCELQDEERGSRSGYGEKSLRDPRDPICAVHVCIPAD
jgi:hypothetical protein